MKDFNFLSNPAKTQVSPRPVCVSLASRCRVLPIILLCLAFSVSAWGEDVTFSEQGYTNAATVTSYNGSTFTVAFSNGKYYTSGSAIRAYSGSTITITPKSGKLTAFTIVFGSGDGSNTITADVGTYSGGSWSGEEDEVILSIGGSSGNRRIAGFSGVTTGSTCSNTPTMSFDDATVNKTTADGSYTQEVNISGKGSG